MYHAKDRRTGKLVAADAASRYADYRCATCQAQVFVRLGKYRAAHFAHMPGQGKAECEDFHPSENLQHLWAIDTSEAQPRNIEPLGLSIELEGKTTPGGGGRRWGLRLTLPKSPDPQGHFLMHLGDGDVRKIPLSVLALGARTYSVSPSALFFGASELSSDVHPAYRAVLEHSLPGLEHKLVNVFSTSHQKPKPKARVLHWGESYYFVWRADSGWVLPDDLLLHPFFDYQGWSCALIVMPNAPDPGVAAWIEKVCELPIARAKREWALIYPLGLGVGEDGSRQVTSVSRLLVATKSADGESEQGKFSCIAGNLPSKSLSISSDRSFIDVTISGGTTREELLLKWDSQDLILLRPRLEERTSAEQVLTIEFDALANNSRASLHTREGRTCLTQVRVAGRRVTGVHGHSCLRGQLRWREQGLFSWKSENLVLLPVSTSSHELSASLSPSQIDFLNRHLQNLAFDVELDFGAFGRFEVHAVMPVVTETSDFKMPADMRSRLVWICKSSAIYATGNGEPLDSLSDAALVNFFSKIAVPAALSSHKRMVMAQLERIHGANLP